LPASCRIRTASVDRISGSSRWCGRRVQGWLNTDFRRASVSGSKHAFAATAIPTWNCAPKDHRFSTHLSQRSLTRHSSRQQQVLDGVRRAQLAQQQELLPLGPDLECLALKDDLRVLLRPCAAMNFAVANALKRKSYLLRLQQDFGGGTALINWRRIQKQATTSATQATSTPQQSRARTPDLPKSATCRSADKRCQFTCRAGSTIFFMASFVSCITSSRS
jgi:hypothetical protein